MFTFIFRLIFCSVLFSQVASLGRHLDELKELIKKTEDLIDCDEEALQRGVNCAGSAQQVGRGLDNNVARGELAAWRVQVAAVDAQVAVVKAQVAGATAIERELREELEV
jgi:hypothetical protein